MLGPYLRKLSGKGINRTVFEVTTKKTATPKSRKRLAPVMRREYHFDYSNARRNRFAGQDARLVVVLGPDIAKVFTTPESVNTMLRALIEAMLPVPN
jgi:hypothetical protein